MADSNEILKVRGLNALILKYFLIYFGSGVKKEEKLCFQNQCLYLLSKILQSYLKKQAILTTKFIINPRSAFLFPGSFFRYSIHKEDHCIC